MPPLAVSFDLDGTLLDGSHIRQTVADTCEAIIIRQPSLDAFRLAEANSRVWDAYFPQIEDDWALGRIDDATVRSEVWRGTLQACGSSDESLVEFARQTFTELEQRRHRLYDDAVPLISELRSQGIPMALVTNGSSTAQRAKLAALDLEDRFEVVVVSGEIGVIKPNPTVFDSVLNMFAVEPARVWHVGDWLPSDIEGANAAGLTSVWVNRQGLLRGADQPVPDIEITSLNDLHIRLSS